MGALAGLGQCLRLAVRRNRIFYPVWLLALTMTMPATVSKYHDLVPAGTDAASWLNQLAANPAMRAMLGPPFDLTTPGGFAMWRVGTFLAAATAMMAALGVIRDTRAEEEPGRQELLRAGAIGARAPLAAALLLASAASAVAGLGSGAAIWSLGEPGAGSLAAGLGITLTGTMFAGLAGLVAQLPASTRTARSWTLGFGLGVGYLLRAVIDGAGDSSWLEPLRWAMPLEWAALARPFADERWWVLLLPLATTVALMAGAVAAEARRDQGAGLLPADVGRGTGAGWLSGPAGLAWRLGRGSVIGWSVGLLASAVVMGSLATSLEEMLKRGTGLDTVGEMMRKMGGSRVLEDAFYQAMLGILVSVAAVAAAQFLNQWRNEEAAHHTELMLSGAVSRLRYALPSVGLGLVVPAIMVLGVGLLLPSVAAVRSSQPELLVTWAGAAAVMLPGLVLVVGIGVALIGWLPRWFPLLWAVIGWTIFCTWIASLFDLPAWLLKLQPWGHLPKLPTESMSWTPVLTETALGVALLVVGLLGYQRRDIS